MSDVPVKVICRCGDDGRLCDPCAQVQFEALHKRCQTDPDCRDRQGLDAPRPEGRERVIGSMIARGGSNTTTVDDSKETWRSISDRLTCLLQDQEKAEAAKERGPLDVMADKLSRRCQP